MLITNEQEIGQCDELVFTVEAETDVGSTGFSTITTGGFPKGTFLGLRCANFAFLSIRI